MSEIEALQAIDTALSGLAPDERSRVLGWAQAKYGAPVQNTPVGTANHAPAQPAAAPLAAPKTKSASNGKSSRKSKSIISMDKSLNLSPSGKQSAVQFGGEKSPSNVIQKSVVAVYYLRHVIELEKVTVEGVFTFFKTLSWPVPADLKNTLQQAGTHGFLDTSISQDIRLTSLGENLVEHELPAKVK
ncbi:hypothetical protein [Devosia nitrariae]|uniref:Uncharacterized protein n=1 Tax=Devosia nitrariae TaxID=2071872 RepID=A0ABQ5WD88_9HYPH|nr:hypothetical protein [Devosia nitrariae]GLQ58059.1 hypothetical protein GCM10010862_53180 [Devosia nitrariae]